MIKNDKTGQRFGRLQVISIAGDAHSRCNHPDVKQDSNPFGAMIEALSGANLEASAKLHIIGNPHGIRSGWFLWPANYDPTWLENCEGFTNKNISEQKEA